MNGIPQLDPLPLPAPAALLWCLLLLTFTLHVVAMNAVLGGSIIAVVVRRRTAADAHAAALARIIAVAMPVAMAATVTLGVAALLFTQALYGRLFFTSAVLMAWIWLAVVPLVIVAYYASYALAFRHGAARSALAVAVAAILVVVAFIYANNMSLMLRPGTFRDMYLASGRGLHLNVADRVLWPRYLHVVTGAIAVAGLLVSLAGLARRGSDRAFAEWAIRYGARWCMVATTVNVAIGIWFLGAQPTPVVLTLIGGSPLAAVTLLAGVLAGGAVIALAMLAATAREPAGPLGWAAAALALTLVLMVLVRDLVRQRTLELAGFQPQAWVVPQWGPIAVFAVLLAAALAIVAWMVAALTKGVPEGAPDVR